MLERVQSLYARGRTAVVRLVHAIPFLGPLFSLSWRSHKVALVQLCISFILSMMPVWLTGLLSEVVARAKQTAGPLGMTGMKAMATSVSQGELFMLAVATLAPVFYFGSGAASDLAIRGGPLAADDRKGEWPFPTAGLHQLAVALLMAVSAVCFYVFRQEQVTASSFVIWTSLATYAAALLMIYAATANNEERVNFSPFEESAEQENAFMVGFAENRRTV